MTEPASTASWAPRGFYRLEVIQQPVRARMSGFALRDRRPLDPPPILQLHINSTTNLNSSVNTHRADSKISASVASSSSSLVSSSTSSAASSLYAQIPQRPDTTGMGRDLPPDAYEGIGNLMLFASLWTPDMTRCISQQPTIRPPTDAPASVMSELTSESTHPTLSHLSEYSQVMMGCLVSACWILTDLSGEKGMFFIFPDISVRTSGTYRLKFDLFDLTEISNSASFTSMYSEPFTVYSPKAFPGMSDSTLLSKCFAKQGVRIHIRPGHGELEQD
ncbi:velvet factor [Chytridium lagenaria]|nr:velvet factor [Chytridium lagenaria]